uniref:Uncharacterized protein n=1 Tax=Eutreptiella gymnastica TaxID=73025 RepID=A0A7S4LE41_9EUGL
MVSYGCTQIHCERLLDNAQCEMQSSVVHQIRLSHLHTLADGCTVRRSGHQDGNEACEGHQVPTSGDNTEHVEDVSDIYNCLGKRARIAAMHNAGQL